MRARLRRARYRSVFVLALACALLAAAGGRLFWLQITRQRDPASVAAWRAQAIEEHGRRGDLIDARGGVLATSVREVDVRVWTSGVVATKKFDYPALLAKELERLVGADPVATRKTLAEPGKWVLLARGVRDPGVIAELRRIAKRPGFRALSLETRFVREYPRGSLFASLLGWVGWKAADPADPEASPDGSVVGTAGLEARCDAALTPTRGKRWVQRDGRQAEMLDPALPETPWRDGRDVVLTLDPLAQLAVEEQLDAAMEEFRPDWAQVVVLDPRTSDVLAIGQRPAPPQPKPALAPVPAGASAEQKAQIEAANLAALASHQTLAVHRVYPPGSSFKPLMLGLVLEQGKATPDTLVDCENGRAFFGKRLIRDTHPKSFLTTTGVLVESSNIGMSRLVLSLVPDDAKRGSPAFQPILDHLRRLGFGVRVGGFTGEENGMVPPLRAMDRNYALASLSFGQQIQVTALQMATACAAIANGGLWRAPRLVSAVAGDEGFDPVPPLPGGDRVVFSSRTASVLRGMCERVVDDGATKRWKPRGWSMGGKTGTAEEERNRAISVSSYWCFAPVAAPRFLVLAILYHPRRGRFAADNAGKVGAAVMGALLEQVDVPRDRPEELLAADSGTPVSRRVRPEVAPLASVEPRVVTSPAVGEGR